MLKILSFTNEYFVKICHRIHFLILKVQMSEQGQNISEWKYFFLLQKKNKVNLVWCKFYQHFWSPKLTGARMTHSWFAHLGGAGCRNKQISHWKGFAYWKCLESDLYSVQYSWKRRYAATDTGARMTPSWFAHLGEGAE